MKHYLHNKWLLETGQHPELSAETVAATVPGCVHTDLLAAGLIPDPYYAQNENELQWIGERDWRYSSSFEPSDALLAQDTIELVCEGLDTVATLELNGQEIARTESMHLAYRFDAKPYLKEGDNSLTITFASALGYAKQQVERLGFLPTSSYPLPFNFIRKMACNFGWDWGPTLVTAGIWQPIYLEAWSGARIASVRPLVSKASPEQAVLDVHVDLEGDTDGLELQCSLTDKEGNVVLSQNLPDQSVQLKIDTPDLWWPRGHGEQPLHTLELNLTKDSTVLDSWSKRIGLRQVRLDTSADEIGSKFVLQVNGKDIFGKGANWIPDDCFVTRVSRERYRERITQAANANMNMLRIWGGGIYEQDDFYNICDELGIMVWQDFLFACAAYPEDELFTALVTEEARQQVTRLANHPSLVLWNGNNENLWGYLDWAFDGKSWREWAAGRNWGNGYYFELLPKIVSELDPSRPYTPGSPYSDSTGIKGIHPLSDKHGTMHIWTVWNQFDYGVYRNFIPRFASEFGHQAPPTFATLKDSIPAEELAPISPSMLHHQKADGGNDKLHRRLYEHFDIPEDIHAWHYLTQLNQARALKTGVEWFRANAPRCTGALYWQINDCWPVTSWAAVDGYGRKKPLWYATRQFFADRLLSIHPRGDARIVYLINDSDDTWETELSLSRQTFAGSVLATEKVTVTVAPRMTKGVPLSSNLCHPVDESNEFVLAEASGCRTTWFFDIDKNLAYPEAAYKLALDGDQLRLTAKTFLRDVCVFVDKLEPDASSSEQLVTLLAGETFIFTLESTRQLTLEEIDSPTIIFSANPFGKTCSPATD